ncbi:AAA family ATPase [Psychrobacter urativorans]|uniref:AAA family ATPase n=1 Tax=Psychrobacter urativorans TaxID=45610 RepID=UPI001917DD00|nr:AAA family ATPase [Psychrobacter urativorans]
MKNEHYSSQTTVIDRLIIKDLHGDKDLNVDIHHNCLIIVGDNGFGKTSVLNIVYSILSANMKHLKDVNFSAVELYYTDPNTEEADFIKISRVELSVYESLNNSRSHKKDITFNTKNSKIIKHYMSSRMIDLFENDPNNSSIEGIESLFNESKSEVTFDNLFIKYEEIKNKISIAKDKLNFQTLFLPTYRRIEQNSEYFGLDEVEDNNINFGMNDVKAAIKNITDEIIQSSINWVSKVNGDIINEIINIEKATIIFDKNNEKQIKKTLNRIDEKHLNKASKDKIFELIESGEIDENETLVYFLNNMLKLYKEQNKNDNKLKDFAKICNKYLKNKQIKYDEIKVSLKVVKSISNEEVDFSLLSSGEKQIISIFARLVLTNDKNIAVIFDEPEISISIKWQKMILEDIFELENCGFLIASTHSPFIFSNRLQQYAVDIEEKLGV